MKISYMVLSFPEVGIIVEICSRLHSLISQSFTGINTQKQCSCLPSDCFIHSLSCPTLLWCVSSRHFGINAMLGTVAMKCLVKELYPLVSPNHFHLCILLCFPPCNDMTKLLRNCSLCCPRIMSQHLENSSTTVRKDLSPAMAVLGNFPTVSTGTRCWILVGQLLLSGKGGLICLPRMHVSQ